MSASNTKDGWVIVVWIEKEKVYRLKENTLRSSKRASIGAFLSQASRYAGRDFPEMLRFKYWQKFGYMTARISIDLPEKKNAK